MMSTTKAVVGALLLAKSAHSWGRDGHCILAEIAQHHLTERARQRALELLGSKGDLANISNWADQVLHTDRFAWTRPLHFTNVRDKACWHGQTEGYSNCTFIYERDCTDDDGNNPGTCVVGAIKNFSAQLRRGLKKHDHTEQTINALNFVVHFIGDIHQPLHNGLLRDEGGTKNMKVFYPVKGEGSHWNLHNVWDFGLIVNHLGKEGHREPMVKEIEKLLKGDWKRRSKKWETNMDLNVWVQEALDMSTEYAYRFPNGTNIRDSHGDRDEVQLSVRAMEPYIKVGGIIHQQLAKGGIRLAAVLNEIFDGDSEHENEVIVV